MSYDEKPNFNLFDADSHFGDSPISSISFCPFIFSMNILFYRACLLTWTLGRFQKPRFIEPSIKQVSDEQNETENLFIRFGKKHTEKVQTLFFSVFWVNRVSEDSKFQFPHHVLNRAVNRKTSQFSSWKLHRGKWKLELINSVNLWRFLSFAVVCLHPPRAFSARLLNNGFMVGSAVHCLVFILLEGWKCESREAERNSKISYHEDPRAKWRHGDLI